MNLTKPQKLIYDMERFAGGSINVICGSMVLVGEKTEEELVNAAKNMLRSNGALRIRICECDGELVQDVQAYTDEDIEVLHFGDKAELDSYAQNYAKQPLVFYGNLCELKVFVYPGHYGILAKIHHIVSDAWTLAMVGSQFNAFLNGVDPDPCSYCEYVETEKEYLQSQRFENDRIFFLEQFKKCDEVTYLSEKHTDDSAADRKTIVIGSELACKIRDYATQNKTSAYTLFMAVLAVYINRIKMNTEKFYIGTAVLNRSGAREKRTMGMFVNTVPMLMELNNEKSFAENLTGVGKTIFSAFRHQKYNYGEVLSSIRSEFGFNERLYDVMLSYQNATVTGLSTEMESTWYHSGMQNESLQIHIDDRDSEGVFRIHYDYQTDKFTAQEIETLHNHLMTLLQDAIDNDTKKLYELELLPPEEKQKVLFDFNDTTLDYPRDKCIHQLFEEQVVRTPNKASVIACDKTLTYAELNEQANCIAYSLIEKGVMLGDIVAFALSRKSYLFSAMLGVLKSGAAYMPIDPAYPEDRIEYMLTESNAKYCINEDNIEELLSNNNATNLNIVVRHNDSFCALHTSGSTGNPKMSLLKHGGMMNFIAANQRFWGNIDAVVSATIITFDAFVMDSVLSVAQGKQVVLASEDEIYNQTLFEKLFEHSDSNMFFSTPTKVENYIKSSNDKTYLSRIKSFVIGGEVFAEHLLELIKGVSPESNVYNIYGPTETTICVMVDELESGKEITIGKPIANTQIYIVDQYMQPTPIGVTGELCIAGDGVGAGYLNRPELTAEKFIKNPFGEGNLYKTGDLAYWREDGNIVYVGRNDFQVKIRGLRIELGEIENAIDGIHGISQAVVVVRKNSEGRQLICAFYTGEEVEAKEIRNHIAKKLPKYMLPHIFTHINEMPLTSSGKVNRKALPEVDMYAIDNAVEYVAPTTEQEKALVTAIEAVLGTNKVGILDNFFDVGGDSLKAIELISKLEKQGYHTDAKTIFECDTVKELAKKLTVAENSDEVLDYSGDIPATDAQMRVYTAQSMNNGSTTYNVPYAFKVESVDFARLQNAINHLIARHESLRTHFENKDGHIVQVINDTVNCPVEMLETDDIAAFVRPFDLGVAPLLRIGVYKNTVMIDIHHIITDGSSMPIFLRELNELYMGRPLENAPVQYKHFAVQKQDHSESEKYWLSVYSDDVPVLEINTDYHHGQKQSFNGSAIYDTVESKLHNCILAFCKERNITPYVFYMGAFNILLSKFSGNEDVVVGMPISGRSSKYLDTIGMFVNTIALRNQPVGTKTIADFLQEVKANSVAAMEHQDYPYGELVKKLHWDTPGRNPLFDVMFAYQSEQMTDVVFGDKKADLLPVPITTAKYDVTFNIMPRENGIVIMAEYCTDLFKENTIQRLVDGYKLILAQMLDARKTLMNISAVTEQDRQKLIYRFNDTAMDYPRDKCVHQLFEEQVAKTPDKVALIACDKTFTYVELNEQANCIAHSLVEHGVVSGDIVAFALSRKSYLIATMLGILKTGAAYLPITANYPQDRIEYMLTDSKATFFVTEDNIPDLLHNKRCENLHTMINSSSLCYCIYTSGSTGKPKAVTVSHQNVHNFILPDVGAFQSSVVDKCECMLATNSIVFDITVQDILLPLLNGISVTLSQNEDIAHIEQLVLTVPSGKTGLIITPTKLQMYMQSEVFCANLNRFSVIMVGAETFPGTLFDELRTYTNAVIYNGYGPTETTCGVLYAEINNSKDITIGKPIANTQIYIVDQYMQPVPIGVTGELCIAGDGVGAGYLNRPELTAEKFIDNTFGEGKLYKTGDLAYWREDGNIVYVGRNDFQVKIRGLRIELGEIENAIDGIDGISQAVVVVRKNTEGRQLICAFYTGTEIDAKEIRNHIGKKLPKYMLPHIFTHLEKTPLTSSGKVNRKALPEVDLYATDNTVEYVAPTTGQEKVLVTAIETVLGANKVGILDNFFDVGGDSLKAIELISKLEKQGYHTDTKTIFECDTVKELAEKLTVAEATEEVLDYSGDIPATDAQMRVYTAQSMQSDSTTYNVPYVFRAESVDPERLQYAVDALIARHESLRTHFENKDGHIVQIINDSAECAVEKLVTDDISAFIRPFDLGQAPLLRVGYYENTVMIDMHHIITDGSSMPVFLRELNELYMGRPLENSPVQYKQFAVQKQDHTESEKYWLSVYSDEVPVVEINTDFHHGQKQSFNGCAIYDAVDIKLHNKILVFCKEQNITPYVFYMGAFNIFLSKFSGNEDIVVGIPISGRGAKYLDTIGMFVNTIALRNKPIGTKTVAEFLQEVKANSINAINHQDYPYGELVKKLHLDTPGRNPLLDVMFAYQSEQMTKVVFGDKQAELLSLPITTSKYDFTFNILPRESNVVVMAEYCTDLYKEDTMQRFVDGYKQILAQLLDSNKALMDISAVSQQERQKLLYEFNNTAIDYPRDKCVHQLFEEQVVRTPDKVAVIACDMTLTYAQLNEQANRIAHSLIAKGVHSGDIVAIKLTRKSYLFSAMLGVLKSGAAYMPIDSTYPEDRIEYMLTESNTKYCIDESNIEELLSNYDTTNLNIVVGNNDSFCALHTSGSTGKPKMSLLKHGSMMNFITANQRFWQGIDTVVSATIVTFDAFVMDSVLSVAQGKQVVLASEDEIYNQTLFEELFAHSKNNMFFSTPTKIENYIVNSPNKSCFSRVKNFVIGGEVFSEHLLDLIKDVSPNSNVYNIYGPTETTICVMVDDLEKGKEITIGKPIANTQIYIVDKHMQPTPIGVIGELCIAGDGVGAGYLNRPELTAEKFIKNPFGEGNLYKTGDLAYWREDGNIAYVGRNDFQVKIRGLRIELGEIENAIDGIDGISQAVVVVRKNSEGRQLICAFYTGEEVEAKEIRNHIGKKLPKYMLPHIFTHLNEMPLTSSGKVNSKALPEVDLENITNDTEYVVPENKQQQLLCGLMEQILDVTPVGIADDFFDLGGDSLKAIEFVSKAHNEGIYFNLQNVFDYPTVKSLCECIENGDKQEISFADVDFSAVNTILEKNKPECITAPRKTDVGNILLSGATGYLGIHILADFLEHDTGTAYCLVRGKDQADSTARLNTLLDFYFDDKYANTDRIQVICADLQKDNFGLSDAVLDSLANSVDTVINSAASVKHYGSYKYFYEANVETTKRLIDFCKTANAKLIHTSTLSVSGNSFSDEFTGYISEDVKPFYESSLYIGQPLDSVYARSKFEAEKAVLDAMADGLQANIMRMGNLSNRLSDGVFQINYESNAALQRVKGMLELGVVPDYLMDIYAEFTPIDEAANALMMIARHFSTEQTVFHINTIKVLYMDKILEFFNKLGFNLKTVSGAEFTEALRKTAEQAGTAHIFEAFINDMDENDQLNYDSNIRIENDFTVQYLKQLGFEWSDIGIDYLRKYVEYFKKIGYLK